MIYVCVGTRVKFNFMHLRFPFIHIDPAQKKTTRFSWFLESQHILNILFLVMCAIYIFHVQCAYILQLQNIKNIKIHIEIDVLRHVLMQQHILEDELNARCPHENKVTDWPLLTVILWIPPEQLIYNWFWGVQKVDEQVGFSSFIVVFSRLHKPIFLNRFMSTVLFAIFLHEGVYDRTEIEIWKSAKILKPVSFAASKLHTL